MEAFSKLKSLPKSQSSYEKFQVTQLFSLLSFLNLSNTNTRLGGYTRKHLPLIEKELIRNFQIRSDHFDSAVSNWDRLLPSTISFLIYLLVNSSNNFPPQERSLTSSVFNWELSSLTSHLVLPEQYVISSNNCLIT